jgi:hypothetical protein
MSQLTKRVFAGGIGLIAARWREVDPNVAAIMGEWLMANGCTAEEFTTGVKRSIAEDEFSPSARRILELGRPQAPSEARAGEVFRRVLELRGWDVRHGYRLVLDVVRAELGEPAARAAAAIGVPRLNGLTDDAYPFVARDFARAFVGFEAEERDRVTSARLIGGTVTNTARVRGGEPVPIAAVTHTLLHKADE